ncbi:hypothetical protein SDRG_09385 [Saprolegnia diclina VS20]|uniref:Uncharacterized protein n=1 Tax=Saprolegnia diclina (strain VS20) TaxID=1156394 RepID=T0QGU1_SAPDV|nr:hypothetical protein SDRG_09385 [Saprolegnia diclina VS20]EQC32850.1 hypothetical protein SDRG_09385 [Saprolegnia diclina VS20]|eukprot:XP_008613536.1 hypothetical protein SDRG_09385 [Saprolegnia diclina VS20]
MRLTTLAVYATTTAVAFWDAGHETVAEIATQLLPKDDVATLNSILSRWNSQFPNTGELTTAAIWPDLIKCSSKAPYCPSPLLPSLYWLDEWHYLDLPLNVNGTDWHGLTSKDGDKLIAASIGGKAIDTLNNALSTFGKTGSNWSANLMLRFLLHTFGDVHQPLHTVAGISADFPNGDNGGNSYQFAQPCNAGSNLHGIWDSGANLYPVNWSPNVNDPNRLEITKNATALIAKFQGQPDALNFAQFAGLSYPDFLKAMKKTGIPSVFFESYDLARSVVYKGIDLTVSNGKVPCPTPEYQAKLLATFEQRVYTAGSRLAVILSQVAKQLRSATLL